MLRRVLRRGSTAAGDPAAAAGGRAAAAASQTTEDLRAAAIDAPRLDEDGGARHVRRSDEELLGALDERFWSEGFDPVRHLLDALPERVEDGWLRDQIGDKDCARDVVGKRLADQVQANYDKFLQGMQHVREVGMDLEATSMLAAGSRRMLARADKDLARTSLHVVWRHRKKRRLAHLRAVLRDVAAGLAEEEEMRQRLDEGDFPRAVALLVSVQARLARLEDYQCVEELAGRAEEARREVERRMFESMQPFALRFDRAQLSQVVRAHQGLGEVGHLASMLQRVYSHAMETGCRRLIVASRGSLTEESLDEAMRMPFADLCASVPRESFHDCFQDALGIVSDALFSCLRAADRLDELAEDAAAAAGADAAADPPSSARPSTRRLDHAPPLQRRESAPELTEEGAAADEEDEEDGARLRLPNGAGAGLAGSKKEREAAGLEAAAAEFRTSRAVVFAKAGSLAVDMLLAASLTTSTVQLEDFLHVLQMGHQLSSIGLMFCSEAGHGGDVRPESAAGRAVLGLRDVLQQKSKEYVANFHKESYEYVRLTLENDVWRPLPLPATFDVHDIKELRQVQASRWALGGPGGGGGAGDDHPAASPSAAHRRSSSARHLLAAGDEEAAGEDELAALRSRHGQHLFSLFTDGRNLFRRQTEEERAAEEREERDRIAERRRRASTDAGRGGGGAGGRDGATTPPDSPRSEVSASSSASSLASGAQRVAPVLTSSSLNLARFIGKYIHIMQVLPQYALNALHGLAELFDTFVYTVFNGFGPRADRFYSDRHEAPHAYPRLRQAMARVRERIERGQMGRFKIGAVASAAASPAGSPPPPGASPAPSPPPSALPNFLAIDLRPPPARASGRVPLVAPPAGDAEPDASESVGAKLRGALSAFKRSRNDDDDRKEDASGDASDDEANGDGDGEEAGPAPLLVTLNGRVRDGMTDPERLFGVLERVTAAETLQFLVRILKEMEHRLALLLPRSEQHRAAKFMQYAEGVSEDLLAYMRRNTAPLMVRMAPVVSSAAANKWDSHSTISTRHSAYVDKLLAQLSQTDSTVKQHGGLPAPAMQALWHETAAYIMERLMVAYGRVKKCSTEGRALMSVDLNELKSGMQSLMGAAARPVPLWDHVLGWVKAYYIPTQEDLLRWVRENPGYTVQQYQNLALCSLGAGLKKKPRNDLLAAVEEAARDAQRSLE